MKAHVVKGYATGTDPIIKVKVDSVDYRSNLTRVYCKIIGRPHTAQRIDEAQIVVTGKTYQAGDIDGVDFRRYFQWEDEGSINIEIDFPPLKSMKTFHLILKTVRGISDTTVRKK